MYANWRPAQIVVAAFGISAAQPPSSEHTLLPPPCPNGVHSLEVKDSGVLALHALQPAAVNIRGREPEDANSIIVTIKNQANLTQRSHDLIRQISELKSRNKENPQSDQERRFTARDVITSIEALEELLGSRSTDDLPELPKDNSILEWDTFSAALAPHLVTCLPYGDCFASFSPPHWNDSLTRLSDWSARGARRLAEGKPLDTVVSDASGQLGASMALGLLSLPDARKLQAINEEYVRLKSDQNVLERWENGTLTVHEAWEGLSKPSRIQISKTVLGDFNLTAEVYVNTEPTKFARAILCDSQFYSKFADLVSDNSEIARAAERELLKQ